jgi:hypothetical protein
MRVYRRGNRGRQRVERASAPSRLRPRFVHTEHNMMSVGQPSGCLQTESSSALPEDALDNADGNPIDLGDLGDRQPVLHPGSDARVVRPRDLARGPGLVVDWCRNFLVADRRRRQDRQHARLPRGSLDRWRGVRNRWLGGLLFRCEERLGCPARARDPLAIITARVVLLPPVVEQELPRVFGYSRYRSGIRQLWQAVTAFAGCRFHVKGRETGDSRKSHLFRIKHGRAFYDGSN